jgi:hypothetical protein
MFYELSRAFLEHVKQDGNKLVVPQQLLISICKEHDPALTPIKAGRVVKDYLKSIGTGDVGITSVVIGSMTRMAYVMNSSLQQLDFGEFNEQLKAKRQKG